MTTRPLIAGPTVHYSYPYSTMQLKELNNTFLSTIYRGWSILETALFFQM